MKNFQEKYTGRDRALRYSYRCYADGRDYDGGEGAVIEVDVFYRLGGVNMMGEPRTRAFVLGVTPLSVRDGMVMYEFNPTNTKEAGLQFPLLEAKRRDERKLREIAEKLDHMAPEIGKKWVAQHEEAILLGRSCAAVV